MQGHGSEKSYYYWLRKFRKACFILAGIDGSSLLQAVDVAVEMNKNRDLGIPVPDYVDENVSDKVVKIIQSYTGA
jgi:UDP-N-acetylglucosamine 2-epimerase (non-hydrolysing)